MVNSLSSILRFKICVINLGGMNFENVWNIDPIRRRLAQHCDVIINAEFELVRNEVL